MIQQKIEADLSTEQKIKEAASKVFTQKGYSATRTRDIAEEAGINLALLNYYFRSKERLFEQIMTERLQQLFGTLGPLMVDTNTNLETKVERIVGHYIDLILENPDLPIFVLSEIRNDGSLFRTKFPLTQILEHSSFVHQIREKRPDIHPFHFLMNILGMTVFPIYFKPGICFHPNGAAAWLSKYDARTQNPHTQMGQIHAGNALKNLPGI